MLCNIDAPPIYPCVYREHGMLRPQFNNPTGLSLCVQGTRLALYFLLSHPSVYPCVYRERESLWILFPITLGLSLCVQGTHKQTIEDDNDVRFIPVCTGNARPI